jgi:hypothetical protein
VGLLPAVAPGRKCRAQTSVEAVIQSITVLIEKLSFLIDSDGAEIITWFARSRMNFTQEHPDFAREYRKMAQELSNLARDSQSRRAILV